MISFQSFVGLLVLSWAAVGAVAENYKLSHTAVVFGEANGVALSLLEALASKHFDVTFVYDGQHYYDTEEKLAEHASAIIRCPQREYRQCGNLTNLAALSQPLDLIIDLVSSSASEISYIFSVFESARKPHLYAYLSSQAIYSACHDGNNVKEFSESHCLPSGNKLAAGAIDVHPAEYELGRQKLESERQLQRLLDTRRVSYLAVRAAPLFGTHELLEPVGGDLLRTSTGDLKKARLLTWLLLSGISAHYNEPIRVPSALRDVKWSMLYADDLAKLAQSVDSLAGLAASQTFARIYNLASTSFTVKTFVATLVAGLGMRERATVQFVSDNAIASGLFYPDFFPQSHTKPMDTSLAQRELHFAPTDSLDAFTATLSFYRNFIAQYDENALPSEKDEPIRVAIDTIVNTGVFNREQVGTFVERLRRQAAGATPNAQLPDGDDDADDDEAPDHAGHSEL